MNMDINCLEKWILLCLDDTRNIRINWNDGEKIAEALTSIDPVWFFNLRSKMRPHACMSWVFMKGNLKRIMVAIRGYYSRHLGLLISKDREPVLGLIARVGDQVELVKMMKLVLGCAVTGREREKHIKRILSLEKEMKTELLMAVKSLELESTLLNMTLAEKEFAKTIKESGGFAVERRNSDDSGIVYDEYYTRNEIESLYGESIGEELLKVDFSCQHDGFFETSFDDDDSQDISHKYVLEFEKLSKPEMKDFECQFDSPVCTTSDIIDIDEAHEVPSMREIGLDPIETIYKTEDASTDPIFQDINTIHQLEKKVVALEILLLDLVGKDAMLSEYEKQIQSLKKNSGVAEGKHKKTRQELNEVRLALKMSACEGENLRRKLEENFVIEEKLVSVLEENQKLLTTQKELEHKIWSLELDQQRKSYFAENLLRLQLNLGHPCKHPRIHRILSQDCTSSISSGFASGSDTSELEIQSSNKISAFQPHTNTDKFKEFQAETERLVDLIGVMEEREEQLISEVKDVEIYRKHAEDKVKEKDCVLATIEKKDQIGRRVKNALLLTSAFGAVHQAIQSEMVMDLKNI